MIVVPEGWRLIREDNLNTILRNAAINNDLTMRERFSNIASDKSMDQVKDMSDKDKEKLREILSDNLAEGKGMRDTARDLEKEFEDIDKKRAMSIARTETTNVKNLGNHEKALEKGFQSFTVDFTAEACEDCVNAYDGIVFSMNDVDMLPALHTHCMCVAVFHMETPEELAEIEGYNVYGSSEEFNDNEEFYQYAEDNLSDQYNDISQNGDLTDKGIILDRYKNTEWYGYANNYLRELDVNPNINIPTLDKEIKLMDTVFEGKSVDNDITVYRTVTNIFDGVKEGSIELDKGYMSTTSNFNYAKSLRNEIEKEGEKGYIMKLAVPKGCRGVQVETALEGKTVRDEGELLMPRSMYVYYKKIDHTRRWVIAEIIDSKLY